MSLFVLLAGLRAEKLEGYKLKKVNRSAGRKWLAALLGLFLIMASNGTQAFEGAPEPIGQGLLRDLDAGRIRFATIAIRKSTTESPTRISPEDFGYVTDNTCKFSVDEISEKSLSLVLREASFQRYATADLDIYYALILYDSNHKELHSIFFSQFFGEESEIPVIVDGFPAKSKKSLIQWMDASATKMNCERKKNLPTVE